MKINSEKLTLISACTRKRSLSCHRQISLPVHLFSHPKCFQIKNPMVRVYRNLSVRPSIHPSVRPSVRPSVCPSVCPSICPSICPSVCRLRPSVSVRPYVRPSMYLVSATPPKWLIGFLCIYLPPSQGVPAVE